MLVVTRGARAVLDRVARLGRTLAVTLGQVAQVARTLVRMHVMLGALEELLGWVALREDRAEPLPRAGHWQARAVRPPVGTSAAAAVRRDRAVCREREADRLS